MGEWVVGEGGFWRAEIAGKLRKIVPWAARRGRAGGRIYWVDAVRAQGAGAVPAELSCLRFPREFSRWA